MSETQELICGCTFDGYEFKGCSEHPASEGNHSMSVLISDEEELEDEDRCELFHGYDKGDRCPNRATQTTEEPFTPGRFRSRVCDECARGQVKQGYTLVSSPEWSFPELSEKDNSAITKARLFGYASFFPCLNGGEVQALKTLAGAREFLEGRK